MSLKAHLPPCVSPVVKEQELMEEASSVEETLDYLWLWFDFNMKVIQGCS